ncbi:MAG: hypothetical protein HY581_10720 [Nitrospirae bacterium]|nr:hypothetical protein [Nitrospirota bacterium]
MDTSESKHLIELGVSYRYAQAHGWVVNAIVGWLSAYYMEDPRFRVSRREHELETGMHVWVCEIEGNMPIKRLLTRLQADIPPFQVHERSTPANGRTRYVIDLAEADSDQSSRT